MDFTIVIPCFNAGAFLEEAVSSAVQQTFDGSRYEVIVVDDGSTDPDTVRRLDTIRGGDVGVLRIAHSGVSAARNTGISYGSSDYCVCLDADDILATTFIERAFDVLEMDRQIGIVYGDVRLFGTYQREMILPRFSLETFLMHNCIVSSAAFRRSDWGRVGGFCTSFLDGWEDYDFWMCILDSGRAAHHLNEVILSYRQREGSRSAGMTALAKAKAYELLLTRHASLYRRHSCQLLRHLVELDAQVEAMNRIPLPVAQFYFPRAAGHVEEASERRVFQSLTENSFEFLVPADAKGRCRFDPCNQPGVVEISAIEISAEDGADLWRWSGGEDGLELGGTARFLRTDPTIQLLCYSNDPQVILPVVESSGCGYRVKITCRYDPYSPVLWEYFQSYEGLR